MRINKRRLLLLITVIAVAVGVSITVYANGKEEPIQAEPVELVAETIQPEIETQEPIIELSAEEKLGITSEESYILRKITMAEAEGESIEGKALVICVILNRVRSKDFPNTIEEVIFQKNQFSPVLDGRYYEVDPNADCEEALQMVADGWDESHGALYFESNGKSTWHRDNLEYLFQLGNHYFYR